MPVTLSGVTALINTRKFMLIKARNVVDLLVEEHYKLSSTQVNLPVALADYCLKWGREMIPDDDLYYDEKGGLGREDEMHVTLLYGLKGSAPTPELLKLIRETPPFTARLTSVTKFDNNPGYDVVKFDVESDEMKSLSDAIRQACPNENKFPVWKGHVTLAYVKKGKVPDIEGNYPFAQNPPVPPEFEVNEVIFKPAGDSEDPNRKPIRIPLNRYKKEAEDPKAVFRKVVTGAAKPRVTNGLEYADVTWEDIKRLKAVGLIGDYVPLKPRLRQHRGDGAFPIAGNHIADDIEIELDLRRLRWYRWVSEDTEEDEDAAVARLKKEYGLGEPDYDLAAAEREADAQGHTQAAAVAAARGWLAKHKRQEALAGFYERRGWLPQRVLMEAEDPKDVLRRAKAAAGVWIARRDNDAHGKPLDRPNYLKVWSNQRPGIEQRFAGAWQLDPKQAHRFRSEEEARAMVNELFGGPVQGDVDYFQDIGLAFDHVLGEAEDPKEFLRKQPHPGFVVVDRKHSMGPIWVRFLPSTEIDDTAFVWIHFESHAYRFASRVEAETVAQHLWDHGYWAKVEQAPSAAVGEARERGPFDFLNFPTDAAVLVAKLLELDRDEPAPAVL